MDCLPKYLPRQQCLHQGSLFTPITVLDVDLVPRHLPPTLRPMEGRHNHRGLPSLEIPPLTNDRRKRDRGDGIKLRTDRYSQESDASRHNSLRYTLVPAWDHFLEQTNADYLGR